MQPLYDLEELVSLSYQNDAMILSAAGYQLSAHAPLATVPTTAIKRTGYKRWFRKRLPHCLPWPNKMVQRQLALPFII
jgi:hypothetical protein